MKTRLLTLAFLVLAGAASAQEAPEGEIYGAHGTEPFWAVTFEDGKIIWHADEERIEFPRPAPIARGNVHVYRTPRFTVEISHEGRCNDGMSDYEYPDTVRVRFGRDPGGRALEGCGGGILPPVTLAETSWAIVEIDGARVGGDNYRLQFDSEDRLSGQAGCNRFSGPYTQAGRALTPGAIVATRMACGEAPTAHETTLLRLLSGPVEIYYRGGMIAVLRGNNLSVTLRRL
jgi:heat shock protein HslJ